MDKPGFWRFFTSQFRLWEGLEKPIKSVQDGKSHYYREIRKERPTWRGTSIALSGTLLILVIMSFLNLKENYVFDFICAYYLVLFLLLPLRYFFIRFEKVSDEYIPSLLKAMRRKRIGNIVFMALALLDVVFMLMNSYSALYLRSRMDESHGSGSQVAARILHNQEDIDLDPGNIEDILSHSEIMVSATKSNDTVRILLNGRSVEPPVYHRYIKLIWDPDYFLQEAVFYSDDYMMSWDKLNTLEVICGRIHQTYTFQLAEKP